MATASWAARVGIAIKKAAAYGNGSGSFWYTPHMAAASRAIADRIPLVDFVLEVRDARIPQSSEYEQLRNFFPTSKRIIVMNKMDLANQSQMKEWMRYLEHSSCIAYCVNAHNKENVKEFLNFLQARVRELKKSDQPNFTTTMLLVGIPNVGKSALANSLHQVGRISAAEKGKLKHALVSPQPGETQNISSFKIGSHPNIYVLDTPSVLPSEIFDIEVCSKLALTGAIKDDMVWEKELAQYFLAILNSSEEYKKWKKFTSDYQKPSINDKARRSESETKRKRQYPSDHTQDFVVNNVRRTLFETIWSFNGNIEDEKDMEGLMELQLTALIEVFQVPLDSYEDTALIKICAKLLNLYRTGRLGHYTLDPVPRIFKSLESGSPNS